MRSGREWNRRIVGEFRVGGPFEGAPVLLLIHTGARGGIERVNPLVCLAVGDGYAGFASNAGKDGHPAWYHDPLAHPRVGVEVGTEEIAVSAREASGEERYAIRERQGEAAPVFAAHEAVTSGRIPVVVVPGPTPR